MVGEVQVQGPTLLPAPAHVLGPTWQRLRTGGWYLPEHSLGWQVINWLAAYVLQPGAPRAGKPFLPTLEQARFLLWWYAVDESGRFVYRSGLLRRLKGWGKDPLCAAMSLAELCGPVAFSHWDRGKPVGKLRDSAWIQIAAVSQDQTRNTFISDLNSACCRQRSLPTVSGSRSTSRRLAATRVRAAS
jgi:hypothetical protein